jgi:YidC/Oxa1 family membrane protein insertase
MQAYYREHGINPLAAFAPLLIQIPVFISLYYLMRHDVKNGLFGDSGLLFIPHLTEKPHGAVLVALVTAYLISQLTGSLIATRTMQGGQRGLMLALPLLFVGIVARFPAGLAVYWITTSLWTLGQQVAFWRLGAGAVPELGGAAVATAGPAPAPASRPATPARPASAGARKRQSRKRKHGRRR